MEDCIEENLEAEVPEIPEMLERVLLFTLDEAKEIMSQGADVVPFTSLVVKDNLFVENHPGETVEECFAYARHTVEGARGAEAYAFCYDGYVETDEGNQDALIAEGGIPGEDEGIAVCYLYKIENATPVFEAEPANLGTGANFMGALTESSEYDEDEIEERYLAEEVADEELASSEE